MCRVEAIMQRMNAEFTSIKNALFVTFQTSLSKISQEYSQNGSKTRLEIKVSKLACHLAFGQFKV